MNDIVVLSQKELRNLQLIQIEMVAEVDRICRKNNIMYSLDGGTLLGAVRNKGFIEWDDDADVIFTRQEYNKFVKACQKDLDEEKFFLQDYQSDPYYRWGYAKLRRNGTEYIRLNQENMRYKTGVYIDIFVCDNVADNRFKRTIQYGELFFIRKALYSELGKEVSQSRFLRLWYALLYKIPKDFLFSWRNRIAASNVNKKTKLISHYLWPYPRKECQYGMPSEIYDEYIDIEFEGMTMRAFSDYDQYLTLAYGDYMTPPPVENRCGHVEASRIQFIPITLEEIWERYQ